MQQALPPAAAQAIGLRLRAASVEVLTAPLPHSLATRVALLADVRTPDRATQPAVGEHGQDEAPGAPLPGFREHTQTHCGTGRRGPRSPIMSTRTDKGAGANAGDQRPLDVGTRVAWPFGTGTGEGTVRDVFTQRVTLTIKGTRVTRNADGENPAYLIEQDDGDEVLKAHSELSEA